MYESDKSVERKRVDRNNKSFISFYRACENQNQVKGCSLLKYTLQVKLFACSIKNKKYRKPNSTAENILKL